MKKYQPNRKNSALHSLALCAIFALILVLTNFSSLTRSGALRETELYLGAGKLETVRNIGDIPLECRGINEYSLIANEKALCHVGLRCSPLLGWYRSCNAYIQLDPSLPAQISNHSISSDTDEDSYCIILFGLINDEAISAIEVPVFDDAPFLSDTKIVDTIYIDSDDFISHDGKTYFYYCFERPNGSFTYFGLSYFLSSEGAQLYTAEMSFGTSTSHG